MQTSAAICGRLPELRVQFLTEARRLAPGAGNLGGWSSCPLAV